MAREEARAEGRLARRKLDEVDADEEPDFSGGTGLPATGAIGFGITPVSGKSLVP